MASEKHKFIVSLIARKIILNGFKIIYIDSNYKYIGLTDYKLPPRVGFHKPDIVGEKSDNSYCIGEAKTKNDILTDRTRNQIKDFYDLIKLNKNNKLILGTSLSGKMNLEKILDKLGIQNDQQIELLYIPDILLPGENEENIHF